MAAGYDVAAASAAAPPPQKKPRPSGEEEESKRQARLESNRKAARESRRRKKVLVEELQRSVIFFTRANAQLKQKNEGLEAMLFAARSQTEIGGGGGGNALGSTAPPQVMANATVLGMQEPVPVPSNEDAKPAAMSQPQAESALMASLPDNLAIANNPVSAPQATFQAQAPGMAQQSLAMQQLQQVQQAQQQAQQQAAGFNMPAIPKPGICNIGLGTIPDPPMAAAWAMASQLAIRALPLLFALLAACCCACCCAC